MHCGLVYIYKTGSNPYLLNLLHHARYILKINYSLIRQLKTRERDLCYR